MLSPLPTKHWNYEMAAHLLNRAGFGGPPAAVAKLAALEPDAAVDSLVDFERTPDDFLNPEWATPDPTRAERFNAMRLASAEEKKKLRQEEQRRQRGRVQELQYWWLRRMVSTPRPLQEKLVLFWHGHFATSAQKVRDPYLMWRQNDTFRQLALGTWTDLLMAVAKDPAMLIWLDQAQSRKQHPNENFAREVMELFALGEGHYTEKDVTEAARALTGWSYDPTAQKFVERPRAHDAGVKSVLGREGRLKGQDVIETIARHPQSARFLMSKLWTFFAGENPSPALIDALAAEFRKSEGRFQPVLRIMFRCEEFYARDIIRQQVKSPVQWLVGSVRMLERELPPSQVCLNALRLLGQELFLPPNVKGWDGGLSWITTNNLLNRYNFASYLVLGENPLAMKAGGKAKARAERGKDRKLALPGGRINIREILSEPQRQDKEMLLGALEKRLLQGKLREKQAQTLRDYLEAQGTLDEEDILHAIRLIMSTPDYQLT